MQSNEIRSRFLSFFEKRGHTILQSASLVPKNDPTVLFNTAGMQPLVPYLLGQKHPMGTRLADAQKCVRTVDIDEVGDNRHLTFFEMLGNWSLGDYFKEETIGWSYEFLTSKEEGLGIDPSRLYVSVFAGDENAPRDEEGATIWKKYLPENRIYYLPAKNNWWSLGENGVCGPDTEIFYDISSDQIGDMNHDEFVTADDEGKIVEIWNNVFMVYEKEGSNIKPLAQKNIDTGMGFERVVMVCQGVSTVFDTDIFSTVISLLKTKANEYKNTSAKIAADHFRTALFLSADGVVPASKDAGYILRRLIRRGWIHMKKLNSAATTADLREILDIYVSLYEKTYPEITALQENKYAIIADEVEKFSKTLESGLKEFEKGIDPFILATTYGFPIEVTIELAKEKEIHIDLDDFHKKMKDHQKLSQSASAGMFKGGLANHNAQTIKLHTAHHLLLAALQRVVDPKIKQRGSNITEDRLRIDFLCDHKLTDEEKKNVEDWVNEKIKEGLRVVCRNIPLSEAENIGAEMEFGTKYPDVVSVYFIEDEKGNQISKEFCGGPHVSNTSELSIADTDTKTTKRFKIQKEEAVSAGVRRIKATLE